MYTHTQKSYLAFAYASRRPSVMFFHLYARNRRTKLFFIAPKFDVNIDISKMYCKFVWNCLFLKKCISMYIFRRMHSIGSKKNSICNDCSSFLFCLAPFLKTFKVKHRGNFFKILIFMFALWQLLPILFYLFFFLLLISSIPNYLCKFHILTYISYLIRNQCR